MQVTIRDLMQAIAAGDDRRAEEAAMAVGRQADTALPHLLEMLVSDDRDHRWWAVRALAAAASPGAGTAVVAALIDPDPDVRACAVIAAAELKPPGAVEPLVALLSDPSAYVARLAADGLARFGASAVGQLVDALRDGTPAVRAGAARALREIQPEEAIPALCAALDDPSAVVTHYAEEALERMGVGMVYFRP